MTEPAFASPPGPGADEMRRRLAAELGLPPRLGFTALALAGLGVATATGSLLATEAGLPMRTRAAFAAITLGGLAWAAFAVWVLARRRVLFAEHRVVAASMGVGFSCLFTAGALGLWFAGSRQEPAALAAAGAGASMMLAASIVLVGARSRVRQMRARKQEIEQLLAAEAR